MGDKKLNWPLKILLVAVGFSLPLATLALIGVTIPNLREPDKSLSKPRNHIIRSIIVRVTPVDGEPGAYVLEYDNGYVEVVHADGTREQLKLDQLPEHEHVQSLRPHSASGQRPRTDGTSD